MESLFPWSKIDDKEFEEVTLEVAERSMPGSNFSLYLKKGHAQEGIDIKSALIDGKYICIQCKHVKELTTTLLDKIIELFLAKDFRQRASKFILATTTDLQTPRLQRHLQVWERKLFQEHGISFEYWDVNFIEQSLRYQHSVVKFYFGPATAQKHCYEQIRPESIPTRSEEKQFIPRRIVPFLQTSDSRFPEWHPDRGKEIDMVSLFEGPKRLQPKLIGLIADAHQGKSVLFRQTAYALENINIPFTSLFLELKWQNIGPIGEMLTSVYANWQEVPAKDTVIFIDGLDEAPADKFLEAARHIVAFARENRRTSIVFSCRRVFFNSYRLQEEMGAFDLYELPGLNSFDVEQYIERQLQSRHRSFMKFVREAGIQMLLHEPFYVNTLINQFNETPNKQPKTKINILKKVIANSFKHSDSRQIRSGRKIHQQSVLATKVIENFAFALQLGGNNSLSDDEVQILFEENKRELLENSSLVTIQNGKWSLTNAIFQEHLAAMVLVEFPFEKIVSLVADGATQKKIKTKWIQTISSLLFLLEDKKLYNQILRFVEDDNIELIFLTDPSKYDNTLKADMLERLIQRFQTYRIRPMITNEETIAVFIQSSQPAVEFLLTVLKGEYAVVVKTVAIRVLKYLTLNNNQKQAIYTLARVELPQTTYDNYANLLMEVLVINELGDEHFIQSLIEDGKLNNSHEYRSGVYRLIVTFNLSDRFCDYLFSGIEALIRHNSQIIRSNSGYWFELAVSKFKTPQNIKRLLGLFLSAPWQNYYEGATAKDFLSQILSNIAKVYSQDPTVVFPVIAFVKSLGDEYRKNTYTVVDEFFEKTGTSTLAVRLLQKEIFSDKQWLLGGLVTEDSFDFILDVVEEEEKYFPNRLRLIIKALQYRNKQILSQKFLTLVDEAYEGTFSRDITGPSVYQVWEEKRRKNDLSYIQSQQSFRKGVEKYFKAYGAENIPINELYLEEESEPRRLKVDSVFVARLLCAWVPGDADVWLEDALDFVDNEINFRYFRINEILNYRSGSKSDPGLLDQIVATFYNEELLQADFSNCRWDNYNEQTLTGEGYNHREELLGRLYMQYRFPTDKKRLMEMVWLDGEGTYSLDPYTVSTRPTLSHMILEELNEDEKAVFGMSLIANIRSGIKCRRVLATHLQLCKYLGVQQAREIVLEMLLGGSYEAIGLLELTDIYINLDGDPSELKGIFHSLSHDSLEFIKYVSLLIGTIPEEVGPALLSCIADNGVDKDIRGTAARHLCNIGEMAGFDYLIEYMRLNRRTSPSMQDSLKISPVDTAVALERMNDLIHVLVEPEQAFTRFYESVAYTLQEWLYKFAEKSERDLDIVVQYLLAWQQKFQDTHPLHYNLYWYAFRAIENFRKIQPQSKNIREIKILLSQYS